MPVANHATRALDNRNESHVIPLVHIRFADDVRVARRQQSKTDAIRSKKRVSRVLRGI